MVANKIIFNRHRFAETTDQYNAASTADRLPEARTFMKTKIQEFANMLAADAGARAFFGNSTDAMFTNASTIDNVRPGTIELWISDNHSDFAQFMAKIEYQIVDDADYEKFRVCYDKLAVRSYNDSLGTRHDSQALPTFKTEVPEINQELTDLGVATDDRSVETELNNIITRTAADHSANPNPATLRAAVELALYNEGLWGLRDLAPAVYRNQYQHWLPEYRTRETFNLDIYRAVFQQSQNQANQMEMGR